MPLIRIISLALRLILIVLLAVWQIRTIFFSRVVDPDYLVSRVTDPDRLVSCLADPDHLVSCLADSDLLVSCLADSDLLVSCLADSDNLVSLCLVQIISLAAWWIRIVWLTLRLIRTISGSFCYANPELLISLCVLRIPGYESCSLVKKNKMLEIITCTFPVFQYHLAFYCNFQILIIKRKHYAKPNLQH